MRLAPQEVRTFFVTAVTWQRRSLFNAEPMARLFIETLLRYRDQDRFQLHEFVIMPDHFHLLITPASEVSLEKAVIDKGRVFVPGEARAGVQCRNLAGRI